MRNLFQHYKSNCPVVSIDPTVSVTLLVLMNTQLKFVQTVQCGNKVGNIGHSSLTVRNIEMDLRISDVT